jgi:hypothetical protein
MQRFATDYALTDIEVNRYIDKEVPGEMAITVIRRLMLCANDPNQGPEALFIELGHLFNAANQFKKDYAEYQAQNNEDHYIGQDTDEEEIDLTPQPEPLDEADGWSGSLYEDETDGP